MLQIPVNTNGGSELLQRVNIDGTTLQMRFLWNRTDGRWFADFESVNGKRSGVRIVPNTPLLGSVNPVLKDGDLYVLLDDNMETRGPVFENFGVEWGLYYLSRSDVAELRSAGVI